MTKTCSKVIANKMREGGREKERGGKKQAFEMRMKNAFKRR